MWRKGADLLQVDWAKAAPGTVLVIDLFAGYGGFLMAFLATGTTVYAASAECDPDAQRVLRHAFPHHILFEDVAQVKASSFQLLLRKRNVVAVFIGAGPPCQPNSSLNVGGMGAKDPRAQLATHVVRVRA